ncbi:MAG: beta strand repeat-containing protein, partial [Candidatus Spyradosoma sp.]
MNSRIRRSSRFFNFIALAMRARRAAGVPAFLLAAAALGVAAVPARAADNVTVYESDGTTVVASGDTLDEVKDSVQSGYVVVFSDDASSGTTLSFSGDATLTLQSDSDTVRTVTGTADFFSFANETTNTLNLSDLVFDGNGSVCFASVSAGTLEIVGDEATIRNMNSSSYGGAIHAGRTTNLGTVTLSGTLTFSTNTSSGHGGALAAENVTLSGRTTFTGNKGSFGGAIYTTDTVAFSDAGSEATFTTNTSSGSGGAIYTGKNVTFSGDGSRTTFTGNKGSSGGAIYAYSSSGTVTFSGDGSTTIFEDNTASNKGGAIYAAGNVAFSGAGASATFSGNTANGAANDVYAKGNVSVSGTGTYSFGGGVVTAGTLSISDGATVTFGAGSITNIGGVLELSGATLTIAGGNTTRFAVGGGVAFGTGTTNSLIFEVGEGQLDDDGETLLLSGDASALASSPEVMTLRYTGSGAANVERLLSASGSGVVLTETEYAFTLTRGGNVVGYGNALDAYTKAGASVSVADGSVITVYADGANAAPLVFSQSATLTLRSATAGVVRTITGTDGTERFFSFAGSMNTLNLSDLVFDGNGSLRFARDNSGTLEIVGDNVTIRNMASEGVGAIYADRVILLGKLTFSGDECDYGGAVGAHGSVSLLGSGSTTTFSNNTASTGDGGAIYAGTDVTFSGDGASATFTNNTASDRGGAIFTYSGNVTFSGDGASATFSGNTANGAANDVYARGNVSVSGTGTYSFGGGIVTAGTLSISDGATVTFADGAINAIAGATTISGAGTTATFANDGAGALNTFSGGLTVSDGATVKIGTSAATPAAAGTVTFAGDGATLDFTGGVFAFEEGAKLALAGSGLTMKLENW